MFSAVPLVKISQKSLTVKLIASSPKVMFSRQAWISHDVWVFRSDGPGFWDFSQAGTTSNWSHRLTVAVNDRSPQKSRGLGDMTPFMNSDPQQSSGHTFVLNGVTCWCSSAYLRQAMPFEISEKKETERIDNVVFKKSHSADRCEWIMMWMLTWRWVAHSWYSMYSTVCATRPHAWHLMYVIEVTIGTFSVA